MRVNRTRGRILGDRSPRLAQLDRLSSRGRTPCRPEYRAIADLDARSGQAVLDTDPDWAEIYLANGTLRLLSLALVFLGSVLARLGRSGRVPALADLGAGARCAQLRPEPRRRARDPCRRGGRGLRHSLTEAIHARCRSCRRRDRLGCATARSHGAMPRGRLSSTMARIGAARSPENSGRHATVMRTSAGRRARRASPALRCHHVPGQRDMAGRITQSSVA